MEQCKHKHKHSMVLTIDASISMSIRNLCASEDGPLLTPSLRLVFTSNGVGVVSWVERALIT